MTCYFCGDETEDVVETDRPLGKGKRLEYKKIGVCKKKRCQKKLERRLNKRLSGPEKSKIVPFPAYGFQSPVLVQDAGSDQTGQHLNPKLHFGEKRCEPKMMVLNVATAPKWQVGKTA